MSDSVRTAGRTLAAAATLLIVTATGAAQSFPYVGVVTGENVYVRAGNDQNYYPVAKVQSGQRVTVRSESFGWLEIAPLPGTFSFVDKAYVDRSGETGTVTANRLWVRAGSLLSDQRSAPQTRLPEGQTVRILGESEGFYKIETPESASLWISARYVVPVDQADASLAARTPAIGSNAAPGPQQAREMLESGVIRRGSDPPPAPADEADTDAAAERQTADVAAATTQPAESNWHQRFETLEAKVKAEAGKPLTERDWKPLIAEYQPLAEQNQDAAVAAAARIRIESLERLSRTREALEAVERADRLFASEMRIMDRPLPAPATRAAEEPKWDARGVLKASWVFTGLNTPKLYRLVDPATDTAVAYVQQTPDLANELESLAGQYVTVRAARTSFRPEWNVNLIVPAAVAAAESPAGATARPMEQPPVAAPADPQTAAAE